MPTYRYWQHFLALEADFAATSRYVEFSRENFSTFSVEYAKLLLAVGSEIDVLCKIACEKIDSTARRENINDFRACITAHTQLVSEEISIQEVLPRIQALGRLVYGQEPVLVAKLQ